MTTYTMSINEFMNGSTDWKKEVKGFEKALNKANKRLQKVMKGNTLPMSAIVPVVLAVALQPIGLSEVFAATPEAVPVFSMPDIPASLTDKIMSAFKPLIQLVIASSHPLCLLGMMCGALLFMINQKDKGISIITNAGIGYVLLQLLPFMMDMLVEITKAL